MTYTQKIFLLSICIFGCKETGVSPTRSSEFFPLAVGNYWTYKFSPALTNTDSLFTETVTLDTMIADQKWFGLSSSIQPRRSISLYRNFENGLYVLTGFPTTNPRLLYKYPGELNEQYPVFSSTDTVQIIATNQIAVTNVGSFDCLVYQRRFITTNASGDTTILFADTYVSPGVGKVKEELYSFDSTMTKHSAESVLVQYAFK